MLIIPVLKAEFIASLLQCLVSHVILFFFPQYFFWTVVHILSRIIDHDVKIFLFAFYNIISSNSYIW